MTKKNLKDFMVDEEHYINNKGEKVKIKKFECRIADLEENIPSTNREKDDSLRQIPRIHNGSKNLQPWINSDGRYKTIDELKEESKCWSASIWESYLKTIEKTSTEKTLNKPYEVDYVSVEAYLKSLNEADNINHFQELRKLFVDALTLLPRAQAQTLKLKYIDDLSIEQIAQIQKVSCRSSQRNLYRGLNALETVMDNQHIKILKKICDMRFD